MKSLIVYGKSCVRIWYKLFTVYDDVKLCRNVSNERSWSGWEKGV